MLRVVSQSGALIRENVDIMTSRVVYLAPVGTSLRAYDRRSTSDGSIRYRTELGWLSEYRRDKERLPLVELLDMVPSLDPCSSFHGELTSDDLMTYRQSAALVMGRIHVALKQVAVNLSRSIIAESPTSRATVMRSISLADGADAIVNSLTKIVKGLCDSAFGNLDEKGRTIVLRESDDIDANYTEIATTSSDQRVRVGDRRYKREDEEEEQATESVQVDAATACLFLGAVMKYVVMPIIDDNSNFINLYLLERFVNESALEALIDCFGFLLAVLQRSLTEDATSLNAQGRCALAAISAFLAFFKRIVVRDALRRSPSVGLLSGKEVDFHRQLFVLLASKLLPIYRSQFMSQIPIDLQREWLVITADLLLSLRALDSDASITAPQRKDNNASFSPSATLTRSLMLMGFEESTITDAASALRSNSIEEVLNYIYRNAVEGESRQLWKSPDEAPDEGESAPKDSGENLKIEQIQSFMEAIERRAVNHVLSLFDSIDLVNRWSTQSDLLAPCVASFLTQMKSSPVASTSSIMNHLTLRLFASEPSDPSLYALLHLLLLLMRQADLSNELDFKLLTRLHDSILRLLYSESNAASLSAWVSPALLLINELALIFMPANSQKSGEIQIDSSDETKAAEGISEETKEVSFLSENEGADPPDLKNVVRRQLADMRLTSLEQRSDVLRLLVSLLRSAQTNSMSSDIAHSAMLLLSTLALDRHVAFEFVINDGWAALLSLPKSCSFREASTLFALISRRCMETDQELKYSFTHAVRSILKSSVSADVTLDKFLELTRSYLCRNPESYFDVICSHVKFIREVNGKVMVKLQGEDAVFEKQQPEDQVNLTLLALLSRAMNPHDDTKLFTSTDAMEALADCILAIRNVSSQVIKHNCGTKGFVSIPNFIIHNILSLNSSTDAATFDRVKAAFRLMCVLSSYRGPSRRCVLDAILEGLSSAANNHSPTSTQTLVLRHVGTLVSYVMKSSKSKDSRSSSSHPYANQNVCVDIVQYLVTANLTLLLTNAVSALALESKEAVPVFEALIEPLETITRPQLLLHLSKSNKAENSRVAHLEDTRDEVFDNSAPRSPFEAPLGRTDVVVTSQGGEDEESSAEVLCL